MFAEKHYPEFLLPEELDTYLASGWYRMGQTIFTTHFLCFGNRFYSAIWVRLPLVDYRFSKSLRKIHRRITSQFQIVIRAAILDTEKERLYQKYKATFSGILAPTLQDSLLDGEPINVYQTFEVCIYDNNQLIAFSFFDLGANSAASIIGVYDPAYQHYSLGLFTMLAEIGFCQENGFTYYYPGYVVPGYHRFDYKLRIGAVEYFDLRSMHWQPYASLSPAEIPLERMRRNLKQLQKVLAQHDTPTRLLYYPLFEANLFGFWRANYFDYPILLQTELKHPSGGFSLIVYDVRDSSFRLLQCIPFDDFQFYFNQSYANSFDPEQYFIELIVIEECLYASADLEEVKETVLQMVV